MVLDWSWSLLLWLLGANPADLSSQAISTKQCSPAVLLSPLRSSLVQRHLKKALERLSSSCITLSLSISFSVSLSVSLSLFLCLSFSVSLSVPLSFLFHRKLLYYLQLKWVPLNLQIRLQITQLWLCGSQNSRRHNPSSTIDPLDLRWGGWVSLSSLHGISQNFS